MPPLGLPRSAPFRDGSAGLRRQVTARVMRVFEGWGYHEIEIPLIDDYGAVKKGLSLQQVEQSLRFLDRSGRVMMLRTDSTPAIAKVLAYQLEKRAGAQRVSYANKVIRIQKGHAHARLESYQIGVELIGVDSVVAEVELISICIEVLKVLNIKETRINLSDHELVDRLLTITGVPGRVRQEVKQAIHARDALLARSILTTIGVRDYLIEAVEAVADLSGGVAQLDRIEQLVANDPELRKKIEEIRELYDILVALGYGDVVHIDLGELRNPHYYDGIAFNVVSEGVGRSIGGGGRYDHLFGAFGKKTPAAGFAFSTELLCELVYPHLAEDAPFTSSVDGVSIDSDQIVEGFLEVLDRRRRKEPTRVVVKSPPSKK